MQDLGRITFSAIGAGFDLLVAVEDEAAPTGYSAVATPVIAIEVEPAHNGKDRDVVAVGLDGQTSSTGDTGIRSPSGLVATMHGDTYPSTDDWLAAHAEMDRRRERMREARAARDLI